MLFALRIVFAGKCKSTMTMKDSNGDKIIYKYSMNCNQDCVKIVSVEREAYEILGY